MIFFGVFSAIFAPKSQLNQLFSVVKIPQRKQHLKSAQQAAISFSATQACAGQFSALVGRFARRILRVGMHVFNALHVLSYLN